MTGTVPGDIKRHNFYTSYNPYQLEINTNCFDTCFIIVSLTALQMIRFDMVEINQIT